MASSPATPSQEMAEQEAIKKKEEDLVRDKVVNTWKEVTRIPTISKGYFTENKSTINVHSFWGVDDLGKKESESFLRHIVIPKSLLNWSSANEIDISSDVSTSAPIPLAIKFQCITPDGSKQAILTGGKPKGPNGPGDEKEFLQIWSGQSLNKTYDLKELDKHKSPSGVYTKGAFGTTMQWDRTGNKLAYLAEKKPPNAKPFFTSYTKVEEEVNGKKPGPVIGGEYGLKQNWGEQLKDFSDTVIVVLDTQTDEFKVLPIPEEESIFLMDIQWVNSDEIIGVGVSKQDWRFGLIYCSNRPSRIFKFDLRTNTFEYLSREGVGSFSPRVKPDGSLVIWQERSSNVDSPHRTGYTLMGMDLKSKEPRILYEASPPNGFPLYDELRENCFHPEEPKFYAITINEGRIRLLEFILKEANTKVDIRIIQEPSDIVNILWISKNYLLASTNTSLAAPSLKLIQIGEGEFKKSAKITTPEWNSTSLDIEHQVKFIPGLTSNTPASIYIGPKNNNENAVPLIVFPHGGPHSSYVDSYNPEILFFLRLGFAVLKLNYIGSLGTKKDTTTLLLGKIGFDDVEDCQKTVERLLEQEKNIDRNKIVVYGGSHGGFLGAHLSTTFPDIYKAACLLNPVTDLSTMIGTSDITDWVYAECGIPVDSDLKTLLPTGGSMENFKKLYDASPINKVKNIKAPTLLLLGTQDLRVPMSQGMGYYRALIAHGKEADVRIYDDCHPLSQVNIELDLICHLGLWFLKHTR